MKQASKSKERGQSEPAPGLVLEAHWRLQEPLHRQMPGVSRALSFVVVPFAISVRSEAPPHSMSLPNTEPSLWIPPGFLLTCLLSPTGHEVPGRCHPWARPTRPSHLIPNQVNGLMASLSVKGIITSMTLQGLQTSLCILSEPLSVSLGGSDTSPCSPNPKELFAFLGQGDTEKTLGPQTSVHPSCHPHQSR